MSFHSILFPNTADQAPDERLTPPDLFADLNLNQIVAAVTASKEEYNLKPFFYMPLQDVDAVFWRHEIMQDLERSQLFENMKDFAENLRTMRKHLAQAGKLYYKLQKQRWFLDAVEIYCAAVNRLARDLSAAELTARGLVAFREYVARYVASEHFLSLLEQTKKLLSELAAIQYAFLISGDRVQVRLHAGEPDYSEEVEATFEKFQQGAVKDYSFKFNDPPEMNHIEAQILALVAQLYPEVFTALDNFNLASQDYQDNTILRFDREIQFYIAYLEHIARFQQAGLNFCYPHVVRDGKEIHSDQSFDLALADKLRAERGAIVCNDFYLKGRERMIVVSGPNQGGKTTFARTFGQLHYLAALGCPVPGTRAQLFLCDKLLTHFEKEENINNLRGKLQDDLIRIHRILERATPASILIMNEIFTSTTLSDAVVLSKKVAAKITALGLLCLWVTFVDELGSLGEQTVSMVSTVVPDNPAQRTYKIVRRPADGLAYAMAIAEKYRVTYPRIKERMGS
jgi:DNA mismatch repair ATPase MutS